MVKNLKVLRNKSGMSQQQLADVIGISQQSVNKYENHKVEPDIDTLIRIADCFGVTVDQLIGRIAPPEYESSTEIQSDKQDFIKSFDLLDEEERKSILFIMNKYLKSKK